MSKESICEHCQAIFTYKATDRLGKFCSQKCHYASKRDKSFCIHCMKEFEKRIKDPRKTCSKACFMVSRRIKLPQKSFFERVREGLRHIFNGEIGS